MNLDEFLHHLAAMPEWRDHGRVTPASRAANGDTPLHAAIWAGDDEAARALIDAGADVNAMGEDGYTPFHAAIAQSRRGAGAAPDRPRRVVGGGELVRLLGARGGPALRRSGRSRPARTGTGWSASCRAESATSGSSPVTTAICGSISSCCVSRPEFVRQRAAALARSARAARRRRRLRAARRRRVRRADGRAGAGGRVLLRRARHARRGGRGRARFSRWSTACPRVVRPRLRGKRVAIVNDVISAGSAVRGTLADLTACDATPVVIGALAVLGPAAAALAADHGLTLESVASFPFSMWTPGECPLCRSGVALESTPTGDIV